MNNFVYSATTGGFYIVGLHSDIPNDAVAITEQYHDDLIEKQGEGFVITANGEGYPVATPRPLPTIKELRAGMVIRADIAQFKLVKLGFFEKCDSVIMDSTSSDLRILWNTSPDYHRLDPNLIELLTAAGFDDDAIDRLFVD